MPRIFRQTILPALRSGAWFGLKASLAIFGGVFLAIYGGSAACWLYVRLVKGSFAAIMLIEDQGGHRALQREFLMAAGRVVWLTFCCTALSAVIFAVCALLSARKEDGTAAGPHPLD